jgi:hypothetical protein
LKKVINSEMVPIEAWQPLFFLINITFI